MQMSETKKKHRYVYKSNALARYGQYFLEGYRYELMKEYYPEMIETRYSVKNDKEPIEVLTEIGESLHFYLGNKEVDIDKTALYLLQEYRNDYLGKITLDRI